MHNPTAVQLRETGEPGLRAISPVGAPRTIRACSPPRRGDGLGVPSCRRTPGMTRAEHRADDGCGGGGRLAIGQAGCGACALCPASLRCPESSWGASRRTSRRKPPSARPTPMRQAIRLGERDYARSMSIRAFPAKPSASRCGQLGRMMGLGPVDGLDVRCSPRIRARRARDRVRYVTRRAPTRRQQRSSRADGTGDARDRQIHTTCRAVRRCARHRARRRVRIQDRTGEAVVHAHEFTSRVRGVSAQMSWPGRPSLRASSEINARRIMAAAECASQIVRGGGGWTELAVARHRRAARASRTRSPCSLPAPGSRSRRVCAHRATPHERLSPGAVVPRPFTMRCARVPSSSPRRSPRASHRGLLAVECFVTRRRDARERARTAATQHVHHSESRSDERSSAGARRVTCHWNTSCRPKRHRELAWRRWGHTRRAAKPMRSRSDVAAAPLRQGRRACWSQWHLPPPAATSSRHCRASAVSPAVPGTSARSSARARVALPPR